MYGYGAETIITNATISATALCPPGLVLKEVYSTAATSPSFPVGSGCQLNAGACTGTTCTNVSAGLQNYIVDSSTAPVTTVATIRRITASGGGDGTCTFHAAVVGPPAVPAYTDCIAPILTTANCDAVTNTYDHAPTPIPFCVIPSTYLP